MNPRRLYIGLALLGMLGLASSCRFEPDLTRFERCAGDGSCPSGYTCLAEAKRCLPDCGARGPCPIEPPPDTDAGPGDDGGTDGGPGDDGGTDAGPDAGPPALTFATEVLTPAIENQPYVEELRAAGGTPPYRFSVQEELPEGMTFDGGIISGTYPRPITFYMNVEVQDDSTPPASARKPYTLRVRPQLRVAGPMTLVTGYQGTFYIEKVSATGGLPPYKFALESGGVAPGLQLFDEGTVQGTPSSTGSYSFRVKVTDSDSPPQTAVQQLTMSVGGAPLPLFVDFSTQNVPEAREGTPYQYVLRSMPDTATWKLQAGRLPKGISFNVVGNTATLSGTPTDASDDATFTINVTSGLSSIDRSFTIMVH